MRLAQLRYFLEICRYEHMTKAAKTLHISQPSLTVAMKELEKELGISLFHRVNQRIQLTTEGGYFYTELLPVIHQLDQITDRMKDMGASRNLVKIGIPPMMGSFIFPQLFRKFKSSNPQVRLEIMEYGAIEMQKLIADEILDLSMMIGESRSTEMIEFKPLMTCKIKLCVHPSHPFAAMGHIQLEDLKEEPLILFNNGFYIIKMVLDSFEHRGISPNVVLETSQIHTIKQFIANGLASSFLIENCVLPEENIVLVDVLGLSDVTIGIAWKKNRLLSSNAVKMIKFIHELTL